MTTQKNASARPKAAPIRQPQVKVLNRTDITKRLVAKLTGGEAVIGGIGNTNFDLFAAGHRPENFYMLGSMGLAIPIALGVALARPEQGIVALEGDGSILMSLGCLATIGMVRPRNLTIVIMDNGLYQITGKQPTATQSTADIVAIATGAGIADSHWIHDEEHFDRVFEGPFDSGGPRLFAIKIDDKAGAPGPVRDPALIRNRFMKGLGTGRAGALDG
jgi:thiamine pyrophosphate-dependent acetolactate synthase large subunit-like protein